MKFNAILAAAGLFLSPALLPAQSFEISPFYGYRFGGGFETSAGQDIDLKAAEAFGLCLEFGPQNSDMRLELLWSRQDSSVNLDRLGGPHDLDVTVDQFGVGGIYEAGKGRLKETVSLLLGATVFDPTDADTQVYFTLTAGVGVKYFLLKNLALRADLRGYCSFVEGEGSFISTGGITLIHFSGSTLWQGEISGGITLAF
jgi:hypothetical protein